MKPFRYLCAVLTLVITFLPINSYSNTQALTQEQSEERLKKLKSNIAQVNRWLSRANKEKSGLSNQLEKHDKNINSLSKQIRTTTAKISTLKTELKALNQEQKSNRTELSAQQHFLTEQLKSAYLYGEQSELKALLNSKNPQNLALDMHFFAAIKDAQNTKIKAVKDTLDKIRSTESKILSNKVSMEKQAEQLLEKRSQLKETQKKQKSVLSKLNKNIKTNQQKLAKLKNDQKRLQNLLKEIEQAITDIPIPDDAAPFSKRRGKLPWPAKGKIIGKFGSRLLQGKLKRQGMVIATKDDQEVRAVHSGRVIFSNWIRGFGLLIIIDHGNNYMSLYGNNKSLAKDTGDWVRAKDVIAYAQESSTQNESGLYFELRKHGKPINPQKWLSK